MAYRYLLTAFLCLLLIFSAGEAVSGTVYGGEINIEPDELEAFLDGVIGGQIHEHRIPGAVISIVRGDELLLSKGYGFTDLEEQNRVSPDTSLFRPGSISKLITWTAVMQLVEEDKLDLDEDINTYLDFTIPGDEPITMRNIMTHTTGFEDVGEGLFLLSEEEMMSLGDYLQTYLPNRVFPAGEIMAYSNYATGLAGYIVEIISGQDFPEYAEEHIFQPLAMDSSTFRQPLPETMAEYLARAYKFSGGKYHRGDFEYIPNNAAGAMSTTADDMARFMLAHLQGGILEGKRVLQEETVREMHSRHFTHHPEIPGMALGFVEENINGEEVICHSGATNLFYSGMYLLPRHDLGLFVSYSGGTGMEMAKLFQNFMDRYFPAENNIAADMTLSEEAKTRAEAFMGEYHPTRSNFSSEESLLGIFQRTRVSLDEEGYLIINFMGDSYSFAEASPGLYQNRNYHGSQLLSKAAFIENDNNNTLLFTGGPTAFQKLSWYESTFLLGGVVLLMLVISLGTIFSRGKKFVVEKATGKSDKPCGDSETDLLSAVGQLLKLLIGIFVLAYLVGSVVIFTNIDPAYGVPNIMYNIISLPGNIIFILPYVIAGLTAAAVLFTVQSWQKKYWNLTARINYTFFTLVGIGFVLVLYYVNLI